VDRFQNHQQAQEVLMVNNSINVRSLALKTMAHIDAGGPPFPGSGG